MLLKRNSKLRVITFVVALFVMSLAFTGCQSKDVAKVVTEVAVESIINIDSTEVVDGNVQIKGMTKIDPVKSTYIQYYIGKKQEDTLSVCVICDGFNADDKGNFELTLPVEQLKGPGTYEIVLEQNTRANKIITPEHWKAISKKDGKLIFGDITSMKEISNLAKTVGMEIASTEVTIDGEMFANDAIEIANVSVSEDMVVVEGKTKVDPKKSTYIQYYVGKEYENTLSQCILCDGFNADENGNFKVEIPTTRLKGNGKYQIVLEQNTKANKIITPEHWQAVSKKDGKLIFGDITSMKEISNLALTVGMQTAGKEFTIGEDVVVESPLSVTSRKVEDGKVMIEGKTTIDKEKSTYIQYYIGKEYENTLSNCIVSDGINADEKGNFKLVLPVDQLKGAGDYKIVFEQNAKSNKILGPNNFKAFYKDEEGLKFGHISAMDELSNLALTVGMHIVETNFTVSSK